MYNFVIYNFVIYLCSVCRCLTDNGYIHICDLFTGMKRPQVRYRKPTPEKSRNGVDSQAPPSTGSRVGSFVKEISKHAVNTALETSVAAGVNAAISRIGSGGGGAAPAPAPAAPPAAAGANIRPDPQQAPSGGQRILQSDLKSATDAARRARVRNIVATSASSSSRITAPLAVSFLTVVLALGGAER